MLRVSSRLAWQVVAGEAILLDLESGQAAGLNAVGTFLWPRLATEPEEALVEALVREFDVDAETARRDLAEFVGRLKAQGYLLEES